MANPEIAVVMESPDAENRKEKVTSDNPDSSPKDIKEESALEDNHESSIWSQKVDEIPKEESFFQNYWKKIFVASCLCGVLVDPLFLYVPIIKDDVKCLFLDQKLKIAAVILRLVTDLFYILDIRFRINGSETYSHLIEQPHRYRFCSRLSFWRSYVSTIAEVIWKSNDILIDILAILPLPQFPWLKFGPIRKNGRK